MIDPQKAADHYRAMDLGFSAYTPRRVRATWEQRSEQEQREWWEMQKAVDGMTAATYDPDKKPRW